MTRTPRKPPDPHTIDALYGLEPVFEPSGPGSSSATEFVTIQCPHCGERFETAVDLSAGSFSYVEDCQVCCQPIEIACEVDDAGALAELSANRG
ncbi:MAG: CPXCG motif-containing cysteine-rich protein [Steroidobacteraceae bacterium]